jgi:hypothetical protein
MNTSFPADQRRQGDHYQLIDEDLRRFQLDGFLKIEGLLSSAEIEELEEDYQRFLRQEIEVAGRDFCDMSGDYSRPLSEYDVINVMLPRRYLPKWQGNLYERRAASVAAQLCGEDMELDYDQLLAKPPQRPQGIFHWHQDLAYWPDLPDPRTASFWLAFDRAAEDNGSMRFVPGSHREASLRPHRPLHASREKSHTLTAALRPDDPVHTVSLRPGDATVHCERILHGSGGNGSERWRRAYVVAFRSRETVAQERAMGFTHSHNDSREVVQSVLQRRPRPPS